MRRSRISVKPNFRLGNRSDTDGQPASQGGSEAGDTLPAVKAEEIVRSETPHQQNTALKEPSGDVGIQDGPTMPTKTNENDGATTSSAAPHRRMRISAAPKLVRPKLTSTPRIRPSTCMPSSAPLPLPDDAHVQNHDSTPETQDSGPIISNLLPKSGTPTELPTQSSITPQLASPCVPSTSGLQNSSVCGNKSAEDSPPSPQPGQVPQKPPQEPEPQEHLSSSDPSSVCVTPSKFDKPGSSEVAEKSLDKDRILRALKLKELMKIERRKDIRRKVGHKEYTAVDRSKMTMRDLIYYLPNTSPMRSSVVCEENQTETIIPPSPKQQIKTVEQDDDEEEEECENEEMLVPKVRVSEDGSIILDEESLTVRVQRTSNTKVVENSTALFERGSTTTYSSFRTLNRTKNWSVRETDLFFLAISMVGTDFSLIGQLLTHRNRAAIKSKFKKEEKLNSWRIDKALRNKRPYDKEFFSYLLEKILAKDKDKRKSIKLILPKTAKPRKSRKGKIPNEICESDDDDADVIFHMDDHEHLEDDGDIGVEKENEDVSNVKEADTSVPAKKKRKRIRDASKEKDQDIATEEEVKKKRQRKCRKKTKEEHSRDDTEGERDVNVEGDTINVSKEDELERSTSASKRRRKRTKGDEEEQSEQPVKGAKAKKLKKSCKDVFDHEETVNEHGESCIVNSDVKKKGKRAPNLDVDGGESAKGKKNTKRKKALKMKEKGTAEGEEASEDLHETERLNTPITAQVADTVPSKPPRRGKKPLPNLAKTRRKKSNEPEASNENENESQDGNNHQSVLTAANSPLEDDRLQMQAVVVLEKTPPRQQNLPSPSKIQHKNNNLVPLRASPASPSSSESSTQQARSQRARRVRRDLTTSGKTEGRKGKMAQDETDLESPMVLLESITQESEYEEDDNSLNENLTDVSCLRDFNSQMFQRRPMVVLSREEVDMILDASGQSADEEPSVSPLDLSLNTELSFPLQYSKLMDDDDEGAEAECLFEEPEETANERASCEEKICEELEITESMPAQPDISNLRDISTSLKPEVCSQPEVGLSKETTSCSMEESEPQVNPLACKDVTTVPTVAESSLPMVDLDHVDPICMKLDAALIQETVTNETPTLGTSLEVSHVMEESEKALLPTLIKESELTAESKVTPTGSGMGSRKSLQATSEVNKELQTSIVGPSQTLETLQDSSNSKEDIQESAMASSEIKARTQGCEVAPELQKEPKEKMSVQSRPTRSRILKPKPNLSQKSRGTAFQTQRQDLRTPSILKPMEIQSTVSTEKLLYGHAAEQHSVLGDVSKESVNEEEETSPSNALDQLAPKSTKDFSDTSIAVTDQESVTTVTLNPGSADEFQVASECISSTCDVDMTPPCPPLTSPQPSQTGTQTEGRGTEQMIGPSEDVCAPAEIVQLSEDGTDVEEPTFILTLYEIPVTQAYLPSFSNDSVMTSDPVPLETQASLGFSEQAPTLLSTSMSSRIDSLPIEGGTAENMYSENDFGVVNEALEENGKKEMSAHVITCHEVTASHTKEGNHDGFANLEMGISCFDPDSRFAPLDLAPRIQSTPSEFSVSRGITSLPKDSEDTEQCESVSHLVLPDFFVPVSEDPGDDSSMDRTVAVECKIDSEEASSVRITGNMAENIKEQTISFEPILLDTEDKCDASANLKTGIPHMEPDSECKKGSEFAPLEDLASWVQITPPGFKTSKCMAALPYDPEETEQCGRVSHLVLPDIFVPVLEETGDDVSKDRTETVECKIESKETSSVSVPEELKDNVKEPIFEHMTSRELMLLDAKDEESDAYVNVGAGIPRLDSYSECKTDSQIAPLEDLLPRNQSTALDLSISECIAVSPQDPEETEQCREVSHLVLPDIFVPVLEETGDDSSKDRTVTVECKIDSKETSSFSVSEKLEENVKEEVTSHELLLLESDACATTEAGIPHLDSHSESKKDSEIAPYEDLVPRNQSTAFDFSSSKCIESILPQDSEDTEQCEVSHRLLADVFVPVSEETENDPSKDMTIALEGKLESKESSTVCLPERQCTPYEELTKVENSQAVSNPLLCSDPSEDTPPSTEEKKAPARRRARQIKPQPKLVKRGCAKDDSSKTNQLVKEQSQPTSSHISLPASQKANMTACSNTTDEKAVDRISCIRGDTRGKEVTPESTAEESPKGSQGDVEPTDSKPVSTALHLSKEPKPEEEIVTGDTTIEDKELSMFKSCEGINPQLSCEESCLSLMKPSGSVDSKETEAETQNVFHVVLPDVFVLVSETEEGVSNDLTVSIESSPQRVSLPNKTCGAHSEKLQRNKYIEQELKADDASQTSIKESTQSQSLSVEVKTPVRKRGKQEGKRSRLRQHTSPQTTTASSQLDSPPQDGTMLLEEKLQRRHYIMPCTVRLSSLDTVEVCNLSAPQLGDRKTNNESTIKSSATGQGSVTTLSKESTPSLCDEMKLDHPEVEKKSPLRKKGKKSESSVNTSQAHLKPMQTISHPRQLTIMDWVKKKSQTNLEEEPVKSLRTCSKTQRGDSEEPEGSHLMPALDGTEEVKRSSEVVKESAEDPSVPQVKKSPSRSRAKLQVKPELSKRTCIKNEGKTSTTEQPQTSRLTSPARQQVRAAREKAESEKEIKQPVEEVSNTSNIEATTTEKASIISGPQSPKFQDSWPRVVLPRLKIWTTDTGVCSASSTPTSSPARVLQSTSPPVTPPQLKNSPTQSSSPAVSENPDDDPSRVSHFFLSDIFSEVDRAE